MALRISWRMSYGISIDGGDGRLHRSRDSIPMGQEVAGETLRERVVHHLLDVSASYPFNSQEKQWLVKRWRTI